MATFRMVGRHEIEVETQACKVRIDYAYEPGFVFVNLFDKGLSEHFTIHTYDNEHSRRKLEKLVNEGASEEEAEFLRIVQSFSTPKVQANYFDRFAKGELTLENALKGIRHNKDNYMKYMTAKYLKELEKRFRLVSTVGRDWTHQMKVLYGEVGDARFVLFVDRGREICLSYVMVIRDSEVSLYSVGLGHLTETTYAIFKYIVDGGGRGLSEADFRCFHIDDRGGKVPCGGLSEADFEWLLNFLKDYEQRDQVVVHDKDLYDFIKSIATMNVIAGN
jgi:hypothetical protein